MQSLARPHREVAPLVAAILLTLASVLVPQALRAQTYKNVVTLSGQLPSVLANGLTAAQGRDGSFYASSLEGGTNGLGSIFKFTAAGKLTTLYSFDGTLGQFPYGGLTLGNDGNFYGTTNRGTPSGNGSVYGVTPAGVVSVLHTFTNTGDGTNPAIAPLLGNDGNFYGTTTGVDGSTTLANSTIYKITPTGTFTLLHTLDPATEGSSAGYMILGADGSFYGSTGAGGANGWGTLFRCTPSGVFTLLHTFSNAADGRQGASLAQAASGTIYGTAYLGGAHGNGVVFKMTTTGVFTKLYDLDDTIGDGNGALYTTLGTDGNFYNIALSGGAHNAGTIFKFTPTGTFTKLFDFGGANQGSAPLTGLIEATSGLFYGSTETGSVGNEGVLYSFNVNLTPFVSLVSASGKVGSKVGILGQGFSAASVVKFNGVTATTVTRTGTTFLLATVPTGARDGKVTVTTGTTMLTSTQKYIVHNSWGKGKAMPTARAGGAVGVINGKIYVVSGETNTAIVANNEIYNIATDTWTTGAPIPTPRYAVASAVVNGILYVMGGIGDASQTPLSVVEAYNPTTNTWSTKAPMPITDDSANAVVEGGLIYVIGGYTSGARSAIVQRYNPATNTWASEAPLLTAKSSSVLAWLGTTIVSAGGLPNTNTPSGDNEGYNAATNKWTALKADPTPRNAGCGGTVAGNLIVTGGSDSGTSGNATRVTESYNLTKNAWTTLLPAPVAVIGGMAAVSNNLLYCFGGTDNGALFAGTIYNNVQIYQP